MSEEKNVLTGTVKWFDGEKGYGFITVDDTDYFMHYSSINLPKGRKYLDKNDTVEFELGKNDKGLLATNVTPVLTLDIDRILVALYEHNTDIQYTSFFKDRKSDILSKFKRKRLMLGKLLQEGDNLTICGNPISLLMMVTGQDYLNEGCFVSREDGIECYTTRFNDGECLAGFRSPHNSPNNIVHLINRYSKSIQTYFPKLGDNIIIINGIGSDVQERMNSQDLDSDSCYVTNQTDVVNLAKFVGREVKIKYPVFYSKIQEEKPKKKQPKKKSKNKMTDYFKCPMEILSQLILDKTIDTRVEQQYQRKSIRIKEVFIFPEKGVKKTSQYKTVMRKARAFDTEMKALDSNENNYSDMATYIFESYVKGIQKLKISKSTMQVLISAAFNAESYMQNRLLEILFDYDKKLFLSCFYKKQHPRTPKM